MTTLTRLGAVACAGTLLLAATACGSSPAPSSSPSSPTSPSLAGGMPGFPGAQGEIAAVDGSTAQVQSPQAGQVAVTWNDKTSFSKQVSAALADVKVGSCVMVRSSSASSTEASSTAAESVRISAPVDGSCTGGLGRGTAGGPPAGMPSPPEGMEPPDGAQPRMERIGGAFGEVTAVSANGFTVTSERPDASSETVEVTVSAKTTYTREAAGSASDVKVGSCATARGEADDTGAITATSIALSPKQDGSCGMLVMRGGPRVEAS